MKVCRLAFSSAKLRVISANNIPGRSWPISQTQFLNYNYSRQR